MWVHRTLGSRAAVFRKHAEAQRNRNGVHENVQKSSVKSPALAQRLLKVLLRTLPGKVLEKFQIFSDTTVGFIASFRLWGGQAAGL
jgi:hypothetical protein